MLTELALATYPDGTAPEVTSVVRTSTFLFAAGQETTARLLAAALKHLAEHPELQDGLRAGRDRIPAFLEEVLRVESPVKADFRLARRTTSIGGVEIAAGTPVMLLNGAANRDPAALRVSRAVPHGPAPTPSPTSPSGEAPTPARADRWPVPRAGSASSAFSTAHGASASPKSITGPPVLGASSTSRPGSSAASPSCTSSSMPYRPAVEPRRCRHRASRIGLGMARGLAAHGDAVAILDCHRSDS